MQEIDSLAEQGGFAGVVAVDRSGQIQFAKAYGLAHRAHQVPDTPGTRFAIASRTKGLTAPALVSMISDGARCPRPRPPARYWSGSAAHRPRRDSGAPAGAPVRHRRLPR